jgi:uncharacterized damage-inducible protein DinB
MTILERLLRHDAWTTGALFALSANLSDDLLDREFDIGHQSLRRTFAHIIRNMEVWCDLMSGRPQRNAENGNRPNSIAQLTERLDAVALELLALGRYVEDGNREDELFLDCLENPPQRKTLGGGLVHVATHGMHHRAQCLYMMRKLGMQGLIEGDALSWEAIHLGVDNRRDAAQP